MGKKTTSTGVVGHGDWWPGQFPMSALRDTLSPARRLRREHKRLQRASQRDAAEDEPAVAVATTVRDPRAGQGAAQPGVPDAGESSSSGPSRRRVEIRWPLQGMLEFDEVPDIDDAPSVAVANPYATPSSVIHPQQRARTGEVVSRRPHYVHFAQSLSGVVGPHHALFHDYAAIPAPATSNAFYHDGETPLRRTPRTNRLSCRVPRDANNLHHDEEEYVVAVAPSPPARHAAGGGEPSSPPPRHEGSPLRRSNAVRRASRNGHDEERAGPAAPPPSPVGFFQPSAHAPHHADPESPAPLLTDPAEEGSEEDDKWSWETMR